MTRRFGVFTFTWAWHRKCLYKGQFNFGQEKKELTFRKMGAS